MASVAAASQRMVSAKRGAFASASSRRSLVVRAEGQTSRADGPCTTRRAVLLAGTTLSWLAIPTQDAMAVMPVSADKTSALAPFFGDDKTAMENFKKTPIADQELAGNIDKCVAYLLKTKEDLNYIQTVPDMEVGSDGRKLMRRRMPAVASVLRQVGVTAPAVQEAFGGDRELPLAIMMDVGEILTIAGRSLVMDVTRPGLKSIGYRPETPQNAIVKIDKLLASVPTDAMDRAKTYLK